MTSIVRVASVVVLASLLASTQSSLRGPYLDRAVIERKGGIVKVTANDAAPLFQAVRDLREEYGWRSIMKQLPCTAILISLMLQIQSGVRFTQPKRAFGDQ